MGEVESVAGAHFDHAAGEPAEQSVTVLAGALVSVVAAIRSKSRANSGWWTSRVTLAFAPRAPLGDGSFSRQAACGPRNGSDDEIPFRRAAWKRA